ncbi:MAG: hypothetical protein IPP78_09555 [Holophagaceae bacterium]|nr:hypothetical protein [Holophagaceae bacterium]
MPKKKVEKYVSQAKPKSPVSHAPCAAERQAQDRRESIEKPEEKADLRAIILLKEVQDFQSCVPRAPALAWERVAFAMAFLDNEPRRRVQAFLSKGK